MSARKARENSALQRFYSPRPNHQATETYYRNRTKSISTVMGKLWGSAYKNSKSSQDTHGRYGIHVIP